MFARSRFILLAGFCCLLACRPAAIAQSTGSVDDLILNSATTNLIAADAGNPGPGYDRDSIPITVNCTVTRTVGGAASQVFGVQIQMLDDSGVAVPLSGAPGAGNMILLGPKTIPFGFVGSTAFPVFTGSITPAVTLEASRKYRIAATLVRNPAGVPVSLDAGATKLDRWWHWTQVSSTDTPRHVLGALSAISLQRAVIITSQSGQEAWKVDYSGELRRYDGYEGPAPEDDVPVTVSWRLLDASAGLTPVALTVSSTTATQSMEGHDGGDPTAPTESNLNGTISLTPVNPAGIHPQHNYVIEVTLQHEESPGVTVTDHVLSTTSQRLLRLSGTLQAGAATAAFSGIGNSPGSVAGASLAGNIFTSQLVIPEGLGTWAAKPGYTFGSATPVPVTIDLISGNATLLSGTLPVQSLPGGESGISSHVRFTRSNAFLGQSGFAAEEIEVRFPAGFGIGLTATTRRLQTRHVLYNVLLTPALIPSQASFSIPCAYAAHERAPLRCTGGSVTWNVAAGTFTVPNGPAVYERKPELEALEAAVPLLVDAASARRPANDSWFRAATSAALTVSSTSAQVAQLTGTTTMGAGSLTPHFPAGATLAWTGGGTYEWSAGQPLGTGSLTGAQPAVQSHARAPLGDLCAGTAPQGQVQFVPSVAVWQLGANGVLRQEGSVTSGDVTWGVRPDGASGWRLRNFTLGSFMMPGYVFATKDAPSGKAAAALLLAGTGKPGSPDYSEIPGKTDYQITGGADYAGINLRAAQNAGAAATQLIGATASPVAYPLKPCAKYYLRRGGVSGRHEAMAGAVGSVPLWGFTATFHELAVSMLDSRIHDSRTRAALRIGGPAGPSDFLVELERLKFGAGGELREAAISPLTPAVALAYWGAAIQPLTCRFRFTQSAGPLGCQNLDSGFPVLGVSCQTVHFEQPLTGELGFTPDGNLIAAADPIAAGTFVSSRLRVPSRLNVRSNDSTKSFPLTPVTTAAFNNWAAPDRPAEGFLSMAGKLNVPFFDDVPVHVHLSPSRANGVYLMGPWNDPAGLSAFTDVAFDAANRGYPDGISLADFRNPVTTTSAFHPRVHREWKGLLFEYPVHWEPVRRQFTPQGTSMAHVFVLDVPSELRMLSASVADIGFGVRLGEMPHLNTQQLVADLRENFNQIGGTMRDALGVNFHPEDIVSGLGAIDELLNVNPSDMLDPALDAILGPTILDSLYTQVQAAYTGADADLSNLCARLENGAIAGQESFKAQVIARCQQLTDVTSAGNAWAQTIIDRINQIDIAVRTALHIIEAEEATGKRIAAGRLAQELMRDQGGVLQQVAIVAGTALDIFVINEINASEKTFARVEELLNGLHERLLVLRGQVEIGQGFLVRLQEQVQIAQADLVNGPIATIAQRTVVNLCSYLQAQLDPGRTLLADRPEEIRAQIKSWIKEHFVAQVFAAELRTAIRRAANEVRETMSDSLDAIFGEMNHVIDNVVRKAQNQFTQLQALAARLDNTVRDFTSLEGLGAGEVKGYARINGDQLDEVRMDANFKLKKPNEMEFRGWLLVKTVSSQAPGTSCHTAGQNGLEITIGGAAPLSGLGFANGVKAGADTSLPPPAAQFQLLFALDANNSPLGLDGRFDITGPVKFSYLEVQNLTLGFGAGQNDLYLYGKANGKSRGQEAAVACFMGNHCNIPSLQVIDPRVQGVIEQNLGRAPGGISDLTGFLVYGESWFSLNEAYSIPDTCLFSAKVKGGTGYFGFGGFAPGDGPLQLSVGMIVNYAVKAKILCLVTGNGDLLIVPAVTINNVSALTDFDIITALNSLTLSADAFLTINATLGYCPFCKDYSDSFHLRATVDPLNGLDIDLD